METIVNIVGTLFSNVVNMLKSVNVPATELTFFNLYMGIAIISLSIVVLRMLFGIGASIRISDYKRKVRKAKIAKERENDTK